MLAQLFAALSEPVQRAWCVLALLPPQPDTGGVSFSEQFGGDHRRLDVLTRHGLIAASDDGFPLLIGAAREFVRRHPQAAALARDVFDHLPADDLALGVVEQSLTTGFPALSASERLQKLQRFCRAGLRRGHWARWREILEVVGFDLELAALRTAYGVCLCRLGDWESAEQVFYQVVAECGRAGRFDEQAQALAEWAALARFQGKYERARDFIAQARRYAERARDDHLRDKLAMQEAYICVERGDGAAALRLLVGLPESPSLLALNSEAQFAMGNYEACRTLAQRARRMSEDNLATQASLYSLIGRSYQAEGALAEAGRCLAEAVSLLERLNDRFSLARAQSNLASVLIALGQLADAGRLLADAERAQTRLGDRVGLSATRHNLAILGTRLAKR
jgi:tetratricopeptide (TPR) repeat protein